VTSDDAEPVFCWAMCETCGVEFTDPDSGSVQHTGDPNSEHTVLALEAGRESRIATVRADILARIRETKILGLKIIQGGRP
jgi:hypothetical protein